MEAMSDISNSLISELPLLLPAACASSANRIGIGRSFLNRRLLSKNNNAIADSRKRMAAVRVFFFAIRDAR